MSSVSGRDTHRRLTMLMSLILLLLGVAMIVRTLAAGGGPLSLGMLLGALFILAGAGRIYLARRLPQ